MMAFDKSTIVALPPHLRGKGWGGGMPHNVVRGNLRTHAIEGPE
jgi:hypothetical protein